MTKEGNELDVDKCFKLLTEDILKELKMEKNEENIDIDKNKKKYMARVKGIFTGLMKKLGK